MLLRIFFLCMGIYLISISLSFMIIYLNLLSLGYDFAYYVYYVIKRPEVLLLIPGLLFIIISLKRKRINK